MDSPSKKLTASILKRLSDAKILRDEDAEAIAPKMVVGKLNQDDWRLAIEKALEKKDGK